MEKDSINAKFHNLASYLYLTSVTPSRSSGLIPIRGVVPGLLLSSADIYSLPLISDWGMVINIVPSSAGRLN